MRKSNTLTFLFFVALMGAALLLIYVRRLPAAGFGVPASGGFGNRGCGAVSAASVVWDPIHLAGAPVDFTVSDELELVENFSGSQEDGMLPEEGAEISGAQPEGAEISGAQPEEAIGAPAGPTRDSLFIGDSRTVGIWEYAGLESADFFAATGMSVFNVQEKPISVPTIGKVTLEELLSQEQYAKIYLMLGINELGYSFDEILPQYEKLVTFIQEKQPGAAVFIQANLHVTRARSQSDAYINNEAINRLNGALSELAAGKGAFYLDANPVFDDGNGELSSEKSEDNVHLYAKYYVEWGQWILQETAAKLGEGA